MKSLPATPALLAVARRVVWFKAPADTLANPLHFLAHVMTYGTAEDLAAIRGTVDEDALGEVLDRAPPGIFDARSWAYWHLRCGRRHAPPLPVRTGLQVRRRVDTGRRRDSPTSPNLSAPKGGEEC